MADREIVFRSRIEAPAEEVFRWHARPGALERLTPPWDRVRVIERTGGIENGSRAVLEIARGPARMRWVAEHRDYEEGRSFRDVQVEGPFARWEHLHRFIPDGPEACVLEDRITYALPGGPLGAAGDGVLRKQLHRTFGYRHRVTAADLRAHRAWKGSPMKVLVTGASGFIGASLVPFLTSGGHTVTRLVRREADAGRGEVRWDPDARTIDAGGLGDPDAVVHLAGESIAAGLWTDKRKARILESRTRSTALLAGTLAALPKKPGALLCASAIGYYGNRGAETCREDSEPGKGFLAEVTRAWETATAPAEKAGIRVVHLRIGIVLGAGGGALAKMLPAFRMGVAGRLGGGQQYMSWVALDDVIGAIHHALGSDDLSGPVNVVAPDSVTNAEFTKTLARVLGRPAILPVPAFALRLAMGEMADEMLLASTRVVPARLLERGFGFRHPDLEGALRHALGR